MRYNFPRVKFVSNNAIIKQLEHLQSEVNEVLEAAMTPDIEHLAEELMDVLHSAETALRVLEEFHGVNLCRVRCLVERKNFERFYYDDEP